MVLTKVSDGLGTVRGSMISTGWIEVSRDKPCQVCDKPNYCTMSTDGAVCKCMRIESSKPAKGEFGGWIHQVGARVLDPTWRPTGPPPVEREWTVFAKECFDRGAAIRKSVAVELGVSVESLERLRVGQGFDDYRGLSYSSWPERRPGGKVVGLIRRYSVPVAEGGGCKLGLKGGKHGLYLPQDWFRGAGPVLLPEGGSCTAALLTLGLSAIGRPSNCSGVNMLIGALSDCNRPIVVVGERDRKPERVGTKSQCPSNCDGCSWCYPGRYGARVTAERLQAAMRGKRVFWQMCPAGSKDSRAWLNSETTPSGAKFLHQLTTV